MTRWQDNEAEEGKRGVSLSLTNAVFAKLIKMGSDLGWTPQRMAQELFEEAYVARCMGKAKPDIGAGDDAAKAFEDFRQLAVIAEDWKAKHAITLSAYDAVVADGQNLATEVKRLEAVIAGNARQLLDQADEIRSLRDAAKGQLVVVNQASEILKREAEKLQPSEPAWAAPSSAAQLRAIRAMRAAQNSPAAIARQLGVSIETVRAALA